MAGQKIYLRGVMKFRETLCRFLAEKHTPKDWYLMKQRVGEVIHQIEMILEENHAKPDDLPMPSRMAYSFIKEFHEDRSQKAEDSYNRKSLKKHVSQKKPDGTLDPDIMGFIGYKFLFS